MIWSLIAALCASSALAEAPRLPRAGQRYDFVSTSQDLVAVLRLIGRNLGIAVDIDPTISGKLSKTHRTDLSTSAYLEELAGEFGLVWFFDGSTLHFSPSSAVRTEVFALEFTNGASVIKALSGLEVYQPQFIHRYDLKNHVFLVSGPPSYVDMVKKAVEAVEKASRTEITILRGGGSIVAAEAAVPEVVTSNGAGVNQP
ncbi:hypothetical protein [Ensifer sp. SL37]|uniref:hypothetical protein n=1 Tax=Ensifer sp. SL37 TaxID=2995137 RepID=UPI002273B6A5|nr:hypothetical protein [Ensifer sp. SL37]MCY1740489.1 hypothetical protein [Ensifer sp. SL37]